MLRKTTTLFCVATLFTSFFYGCSDSLSASSTSTKLSSTTSPVTGSSISGDQPIVVRFTKTMSPSTLLVTGSMASGTNGGIWTKTKVNNDTLTITPATSWDTSINSGNLTLNLVDLIGEKAPTISLTYYFRIGLTNFQNASVVIGQPDFISGSTNQGGSADANNFNLAFGNAGYDVETGLLFCGDYQNQRALIFEPIPTTNNENAISVIGEPDFTNVASGVNADQVSGVQTTQVSGGKLFLDNYDSNSVYIYNSVPLLPGTSANVILGHAGFGIDSSSGCSATQLSNPESLSVSGTKLVVTDGGNNRVLIWNTIPTTNGQAPNVVLGQNSFTTCKANDDNQDGTQDGNPTARTFQVPSGVWTDGKKLVVSDSQNNRVLIWNTFPTTNFKSADVVLGQKDFVHNTANDDNQDGIAELTSTARTLFGPYNGIFSNGTQLFVADSNNYRVIVWNTFPTTNFKPADVVLGQMDFAHNNLLAISDQSFNEPSGVALVGNNVIVTDSYNSRYLLFANTK